MPLLQLLARAFLLNRLLGRGQRRRHRGHRGGRHRSGWGRTGPFPSYSRRTRGGSRVTVTGCCLPIPLALAATAALALRQLLSR